MSFSFQPGLPNLLDHARLALADTDSANQLLQDETIVAKLSVFGYLEGLAQLADSLAVRAAQDPTRYAEGSVGLTAEWTDRVAAWRKLADDCRAGGISDPSGVSKPRIAVGELSAPDLTRLRTT